MNSKPLLDVIKFFNLQEPGNLSPFELLEHGQKIIEKFKSEIIRDIDNWEPENKSQNLANIRYSLN